MEHTILKLSEKELIEINGGYWPNKYSFLPGYKTAVAVKYFFSGLVDGIVGGYDQAKKYDEN